MHQLVQNPGVAGHGDFGGQRARRGAVADAIVGDGGPAVGQCFADVGVGVGLLWPVPVGVVVGRAVGQDVDFTGPAERLAVGRRHGPAAGLPFGWRHWHVEGGTPAFAGRMDLERRVPGGGVGWGREQGHRQGCGESCYGEFLERVHTSTNSSSEGRYGLMSPRKIGRTSGRVRPASWNTVFAPVPSQTVRFWMGLRLIRSCSIQAMILV